MSENAAIGVVAGIGALILVGSALLARRRRGEPVGRYALIWLAILVAAFLVSKMVTSG